MKELLEIFRYLVNAISFIWKKTETNDEKQIKILNWIILILVTFTVIWISYILVKKEQSFFPIKPEIVELPYVPSKNVPTNLFKGQFSSNAFKSFNPKSSIPLIISKKAITNQFYCGETVEIKSFAIYGIIHEKTLGPYGYVYTIRYKDNNHTLHEVDCYTDEIIRPLPGTLSPSALIN